MCNFNNNEIVYPLLLIIFGLEIQFEGGVYSLDIKIIATVLFSMSYKSGLCWNLYGGIILFFAKNIANVYF